MEKRDSGSKKRLRNREPRYFRMMPIQPHDRQLEIRKYKPYKIEPSDLLIGVSLFLIVACILIFWIGGEMTVSEYLKGK